MADEYVLTTREMESAYVCDSLGAGIEEAEARRRFSRWLAAHDAETRETVLDALRPEHSDLIPTIQSRLNRAADWLDRLDREGAK